MGPDFLFARPSFLSGFARAIDLGSTLTEFNHSVTPEQADAIAMRADWEAVGQDLREATRQFGREHAGHAVKKPVTRR